jgi:hypothetical protein
LENLWLNERGGVSPTSGQSTQTNWLRNWLSTRLSGSSFFMVTQTRCSLGNLETRGVYSGQRCVPDLSCPAIFRLGTYISQWTPTISRHQPAFSLTFELLPFRYLLYRSGTLQVAHTHVKRAWLCLNWRWRDLLLSPFFIGFRSSTTFLKSYHSGDSQIYPLNLIKRHVISLSPV